MEETPTLKIVMGLPGSGKSHLIEQTLKASVDGPCVHDFHANAIDDSPAPQKSRHYREVVDALNAGASCVIADIAFCRPPRLEAVVGAIRSEVPAFEVEYHCFENQHERCKRNAARRGRESLERELQLIEELSKSYQIPEGARLYEVFEEDSDS
jgi:hypothetical protein